MSSYYYGGADDLELEPYTNYYGGYDGGFEIEGGRVSRPKARKAGKSKSRTGRSKSKASKSKSKSKSRKASKSKTRKPKSKTRKSKSRTRRSTASSRMGLFSI